MRNQGRYLITAGAAGESGEVALGGAEARHLLRVRRARPGDRLELFDGSGRAWEAEMVDSREGVARCRLLREIPAPAPAALRLSIAVAVPRSKRMSFMVEKCAELGVAELIPVAWGRSPRSGSAAAAGRWRRLAESAAKQSRRAELMQVCDPVDAAELVSGFESFDRVLVLDPAAAAPALDALRALPAGARLLAVIGPEGGFEEGDVRALEHAAGPRPLRVTMGRGVLRVETAAVAVAALAMAALPDSPDG